MIHYSKPSVWSREILNNPRVCGRIVKNIHFRIRLCYWYTQNSDAMQHCLCGDSFKRTCRRNPLRRHLLAAAAVVSSSKVPCGPEDRLSLVSTMVLCSPGRSDGQYGTVVGLRAGICLFMPKSQPSSLLSR